MLNLLPECIVASRSELGQWGSLLSTLWTGLRRHDRQLAKEHWWQTSPEAFDDGGAEAAAHYGEVILVSRLPRGHMPCLAYAQLPLQLLASTAPPSSACGEIEQLLVAQVFSTARPRVASVAPSKSQ